ncbi:MAG: hypothetical protein HKN05_03225 [Rhizobiales bacterium]|nr:hypothetical protein [Hyphomicrobiales bacterium]
MTRTTLLRLRVLARRAGIRNALTLTLPAALGLAGALTVATAIPTASEAQAISLGNIQPAASTTQAVTGRIAPRGIIRKYASPPNFGITRDDLGLNQRPPNKGITREDLGLDRNRRAQGFKVRNNRGNGSKRRNHRRRRN